MKLDKARLAGLIAIGYVVFFFGGIVVHYFMSGDEYTLKYSLTLPSVWVAALVGLVTGLGLWNHYHWAWWTGLIGAVIQVFLSIQNITKLISINATPSFGVVVVLSLLTIFIFLVLLPETRKQCVR